MARTNIRTKAKKRRTSRWMRRSEFQLNGARPNRERPLVDEQAIEMPTGSGQDRIASLLTVYVFISEFLSGFVNIYFRKESKWSVEQMCVCVVCLVSLAWRERKLSKASKLSLKSIYPTRFANRSHGRHLSTSDNVCPTGSKFYEGCVNRSFLISQPIMSV